MAKVKGFPNGRWETVDDGGLKIWWIAAKELAAAFEQGLLGEIDVLFTVGEVPGAEWTAACLRRPNQHPLQLHDRGRGSIKVSLLHIG